MQKNSHQPELKNNKQDHFKDCAVYILDITL